VPFFLSNGYSRLRFNGEEMKEKPFWGKSSLLPFSSEDRLWGVKSKTTWSGHGFFNLAPFSIVRQEVSKDTTYLT
jgi:hypothetical protein